jgi:EAL domain-containing protein (putative c-di-GMP-specific phosphodiesterase class I)/GGDEF domain-containing protein
MGPRHPGQAGPERYRKGYLKMKTVLQDRITGLPVYPLLLDRLRTLLDRRRALGVIHLELANLDMVESLYGWQVFDRIVARASGLLRAGLGQELPRGTLLAVDRVAGGRFLLFVAEHPDGGEPDTASLARIGRGVCERMEQAFDEDEFAGLSPGLCFRAGHALLTEDPFYRFERCVHAAVDEARSFHDRREERRDLSWSERARNIIRHRAVGVVFQPIVRLPSREVAGHEALARGPRDTIFEAPRTMFELSGRVGLAGALDRLCCVRALEAAADLEGRSKLFLNVLPQSAEEVFWTEQMLPVLRDRDPGSGGGEIVLELSERGAEHDPQAFGAGLRRIKRDGFAVALDDVGTGRAGLKLVEDVRPDYLKLDATIVRDIDRSVIQQEVLGALVQLAHRIGGQVVAEGVESEAEARVLAQAGAELGQGHLFALPAPARTPRPEPGAGGAGRVPVLGP